jgi:hypothetical protein
MFRTVTGAFFALALTACSEGARPDAIADPCAALKDDALKSVFGSAVSKKELTGPRTMDDEIRSTCDIDFADGQWLTVTGNLHASPMTEEALATFGESDATLSESMGFPVYHRSGDKELTAFPAKTREYHIRIGQNAGQGYSGSFPSDYEDKLEKTVEIVKSLESAGKS